MWKDPDQFIPERLLDENGKLCLKKDRSLPFGAGNNRTGHCRRRPYLLTRNNLISILNSLSIHRFQGKRLCAGETFARNSMFLLVTAIMQNFVIKAPEGKPLPRIEDIDVGIIACSRDFWLKFEPRI